MAESRNICRVCRKGSLHPVEVAEVFHPPGVPPVVVTLLTSRCDHCGKETVRASQVEENLRRRAARADHYGPHLLGEDIFAFRRAYGLTCRAAAKVFGKSTVALSRFESETAYPDASTAKLIRTAMRHPAVLKELADEAGVDVPLWETRCADGLAPRLPRVPRPSV